MNRAFSAILLALSFAVAGCAATLETDIDPSSPDSTNVTYLPGTLAHTITTNLQTRLRELRESGPAFTNDLRMFTNWWFCLNGCFRNPDFWLRDCAGYTATSVWNCNPTGFMINYTALSPRHIITSGHTACGTNHCQINFVTRGGQIVTNHVLVGEYIPQTEFPSLWIGLLVSNLPPSIEIAQIVPTNFFAHLSATSSNRLFRHYPSPDFALLSSCQDRWMWPSRHPFHHIRGGDSGSPVHVLVGTNLVLYLILSGAELYPNYAAIQETMDQLSDSNKAPRFELRPADLSTYPLIQ